MWLLVLIFFVLLTGDLGWASSGCIKCHPVKLDKAHSFPCIRCHSGNDKASRKETAHQGLVSKPAHPSNWMAACGKCHGQEIASLKHSRHYTLSGVVNNVLMAFGLPRVKDFIEIPEPDRIKTKSDLLYDLMRRRCLKCHLFYEGEDYPEARRGTGCAACHLPYAGGKLVDHRFGKPSPRNCLHCHYGNRVGWDYYGFFAHDLPYAFRTPLVGGHLPARPWGIEFHEMTPDVHAQKGMGCVDCHGKEELMEGRTKKDCLSCHEKILGRKPFHTREVLGRVRCSVCHAVWMARDEGLYLTLYEDPDWEEWSELFVQEDAEVEDLFLTYFQGKTPVPKMKDTISGQSRAGVWLLTLKRRSFEKIVLGFDSRGRLSLMRPILDIHLSYVKADGEVPVDDWHPKGPVELPVSPHTIGPGDTFRSFEILKKIRLREDHKP